MHRDGPCTLSLLEESYLSSTPWTAASKMAHTVSRLTSIEQVNANQWNHVVDQGGPSCVTQRYEWLLAIERGTDAEPRHLVVSKKGNPIAILPQFRTYLGLIPRLSSVRPGFGGPVIATDEETCLELLLEAVGDHCTRDVLYNEFRTYDLGAVRHHDHLLSDGYQPRIRQCRFVLDIDRSWDAVLEGMDAERRRGIRRGRELEYTVHDEPVNAQTLLNRYDTYATVMERTGATPLPPAFFRALETCADRLKLFSLEVDGVDHGAYIYLLDDEQHTLQHLFTAVTEASFEVHAPELLHAHALEWGIDQGYDSYELRGAPADYRNGVFRFKSLFGADPRPVIIWERGRPAPALQGIDLARQLYRKFRG